MRLPDQTKECVGFLCVGVETRHPRSAFGILARHFLCGFRLKVRVGKVAEVYSLSYSEALCRKERRMRDHSYVRLQYTRQVGYHTSRLWRNRADPEDEAVDVAVLPIDLPQDAYALINAFT